MVSRDVSLSDNLNQKSHKRALKDMFFEKQRLAFKNLLALKNQVRAEEEREADKVRGFWSEKIYSLHSFIL